MNLLAAALLPAALLSHHHGTLVFDQEFNQPLTPGIWARSWFGGGAEQNARSDPANVTVKRGDLILTYTGRGAVADTDPAQAHGPGFTFGTGYTVKARVYLSGHHGVIGNWPAIWATSDHWPDQGEPDIAEGLGGKLTTNYHSPSGAHNMGGPGGIWTGWHTYTLDRTRGRNFIYWDGHLIRSYRTSDDGGPEYLVLSIGGGSGPAAYGRASQMKVAWLRVYRNP